MSSPILLTPKKNLEPKLYDIMHPLLCVDQLQIEFQNAQRESQTVVNNLSFKISAGETLAVVGESGSGKSVTALSLTRLLPSFPQCQIKGKIYFQNQNLLDLPQRSLRKIRGKHIAYVFQEPSTSLNPVFTVGFQIAESIKQHFPEEREVKKRVITALGDVGIPNPEQRYQSYPHQLSGGMQQRVMIAMALVCQPALLIADEPTTALDVTIQKQIIDLLKSVQSHYHMAIMLITHNFGIVKNFAHNVQVMYRGRIVESGETESVLQHPQHPYTRALIDCIPKLGKRKRRLTTIDHQLINQANEGFTSKLSKDSP